MSVEQTALTAEVGAAGARRRRRNRASTAQQGPPRQTRSQKRAESGAAPGNGRLSGPVRACDQQVMWWHCHAEVLARVRDPGVVTGDAKLEWRLASLRPSG
jgi:hypothetical protein